MPSSTRSATRRAKSSGTRWCGVAPPDHHVGGVQHIVGKTARRLILCGDPDIELIGAFFCRYSAIAPWDPAG